MNFITRLISGVQSNDISAAEVKKKLAQKPKPFLLDVRQPEEFRSGHIPGAKLIPLGQLRARMDELPKDQEILVICQSGSRSQTAAALLAQKGFTNVYNVAGGMSAWERSGLEVSRP